MADLLTPARRSEPAFWDLSDEEPVFLVNEFLSQIPGIPPGSLSAVFGWHLLDLLPRQALPMVMDRLCSYLHSGGSIFYLLREPSLRAGLEVAWWLEDLTMLASSSGENEPYPYKALTNREVERIAPGCSIKTFLTRSGRREVLVIK